MFRKILKASNLECAGRAERPRRSGLRLSISQRRANQSGVALRLPPHSKDQSELVLLKTLGKGIGDRVKLDVVFEKCF